MSAEDSTHQEVAEPVVAQPSDTTIRNSVILSILVPIGGFVWGIVLLIRGRTREGLIVSAVAIAIGGVYAFVYTQIVNQATSPGYSAYDSSTQHDVETQIQDNVGSNSQTGTSVDNVQCVARSKSEMQCLADISADDGSKGQATYDVTLDRSNGRFLINQPQIVQTQGPSDALAP